MARDPIDRIAKLRIIKMSAELEVQLAMKGGSSPTLEIVRRLRDRASESLAALAFVNLHEAKGVTEAITLQNEVKRYDEWLTWMSEIINEGKAFDQELSAEDREEILDHLSESPEGLDEAIALGLVDQHPRDEG